MELPKILPENLTDQDKARLMLVWGNCVYIADDPADVEINDNVITIKVGYGGIGDPTCPGSNTRNEKEIEIGVLKAGPYELDLVGLLVDSGNYEAPVYSDITFRVASTTHPVPAMQNVGSAILAILILLLGYYRLHGGR